MEIPQAGRVADVRPVLESGKDTQCLDSYRPISLTLTMGKVMERLVTNRLRYFAECHNLLTPFRAGFRTHRSTEDQLLRLSQAISDRFQHVLMQRTVMILIDFSRAYDKVWWDALLFKMQQMGVPTMMLRWVQAWLSNRLKWMMFDGEKSNTVILKQGVPQGSVLSPLLFFFYINDLTNGIAQSNVSLFADDVAVWSQASGLLQAEQSLQTNLNYIAEWSKRWKMELSVQKSQCSFFSTSTHEASWRPNLKLSGHALKYNPLSKFLGVTYDRQLTFALHAATVGGKLRRQASALRCLGTTDWGYDKQTLRATFIATG